MKRIVFLAVAMLVLSSVGAWAQGESFIGTVKTLTGASVTVERGSITGVFAFDSKTRVSAKGASTKSRENAAAGKPLTVPDIVHVGDQVVVKYMYMEKTNTMMVSDISVRESLTTKR